MRSELNDHTVSNPGWWYASEYLSCGVLHISGVLLIILARSLIVVEKVPNQVPLSLLDDKLS